jgi:hypothetical protein
MGIQCGVLQCSLNVRFGAPFHKNDRILLSRHIQLLSLGHQHEEDKPGLGAHNLTTEGDEYSRVV